MIAAIGSTAPARLVHYYLDGWRYGYLVKVKGATATIQPIAAYGRETPRCIRIPFADIKEDS